MFKIYKDNGRPGMYRLQYFLVTDTVTPLYTIENISWADADRFVRGNQRTDWITI